MRRAASSRHPIAFTIALVVLAGGSQAQEALITDRPDFTESAVVVPRGSVQIEAGATWQESDGGAEALSGPELLVRWGIHERVELRFGLPDRIDPRRGASGIGDASLGAKFQLGPTARGWDLGIIAEVSVPTGDEAFTSDRVDPSLLFAAGRDLAAGWSLGTQLSVARASSPDGDETLVGATVVTGRGLGSRTGMFLELAAEDGNGDPAVLLHHGYTYLLRPRLQLDIHFGVGLTGAAPDTLIGVGFSLRR